MNSSEDINNEKDATSQIQKRRLQINQNRLETLNFFLKSQHSSIIEIEDEESFGDQQQQPKVNKSTTVPVTMKVSTQQVLSYKNKESGFYKSQKILEKAEINFSENSENFNFDNPKNEDQTMGHFRTNSSQILGIQTMLPSATKKIGKNQVLKNSSPKPFEQTDLRDEHNIQGLGQVKQPEQNSISLRYSNIITQISPPKQSLNNKEGTQQQQTKLTLVDDAAPIQGADPFASYNMSIDQFKNMQKMKHPLSSLNLLLIIIVYVLAFGIAFPLSLQGLVNFKCDLETNYKYHLIYIAVTALCLLPTDVYAYHFNTKVQTQNDFSHTTDGSSCCSILVSGFIMIMNMICTGTFFFELYSDLLIIWVSLFGQSQIMFEFIALIFPLLNRLMQLFVCLRLFLIGLKMKKKTVQQEKIDQYIILMNLYNVSRLLYPNIIHQNQRLLIGVTIKECLYKLIQIILKLILVTESFSNECKGNVTVFIVLILTNILSLIQLIFYMTDRLSFNKKIEHDFNKQGEMTEYVKNHSKFVVIITNQNQDMILKQMNPFVYNQNRYIKTVSISFQNQKELIQQKYRECLLRTIVNCQQYNHKFKELKIFESQLSKLDFTILNQIILSVPRFQRLHIENCTVIDKDLDCFEALKQGIERNKNFRDLILNCKTNTSKSAVYQKISELYELNKDLSIQYINNPSPELPLYDETDFDYFIKYRSSRKNQKIFQFQDWEQLIKRLYQNKCKALDLAELQDIEINLQTQQYKRESRVFLTWLNSLIVDNEKLNRFSVRFQQDSDSPQSTKDKNKFTMNLPDLVKILQTCKNEEIDLKNIKFIQNCEGSIELKDFSLIDEALNFKNTEILHLENLNLKDAKIFNLVSDSDLKKLQSLTLINTSLVTLDNLQNFQKLRSLNLSYNNLVLNSIDLLIYLVTVPQHLDLSHNVQLFSDQKLDFKNAKVLISNLEYISLANTKLNDNSILSSILNLLCDFKHFSNLDISQNQLTDKNLGQIQYVASRRSHKLKFLNLSKNSFTQKISGLLSLDIIESYDLSENLIGMHILDQITTKDANYQTRSLNLSKQMLNSSKQLEDIEQLKVVKIQAFVCLKDLDLSYNNLKPKECENIIDQILKFNIPIETLNLSGNNVGYKACKKLNVLAQRNRKLKVLKLDSAKIQCVGLSYLWLAFNDPEDDLCLDFLSVRDNGINIPWSLRLNFKLCNPLKVKHLDLSNNKLSDKAAKEFQSYFLKNKYIEILDLSYNGMSREGLRRVKEIIRFNTNLRELRVIGNRDIEDNIEMCERRARYDEKQQRIVYYQ